MFLLNLIRSKPDFTKNNGDVVVDLSRKSFTMPDVAKSQPYIVPEEFAMRPDLVSLFLYKDQNQLDVLLKFNGISNPFALNKGDIIYAPTLDDLTASVALSNSSAIIDKSKGVISGQRTLTPKTQQDKNRLNQLNQQALPNNVNTPTDNNVTVNNGQIIFGEDVTSVTSDKCQDTVSRAKLKETLLANKIFNT